MRRVLVMIGALLGLGCEVRPTGLDTIRLDGGPPWWSCRSASAYDAPRPVRWAFTRDTLVVGAARRSVLRAMAFDSAGARVDQFHGNFLSWSVEDERVLRIEKTDGAEAIVRAGAGGQTTVTIEHIGLSATVVVEVGRPVSRVELTSSSVRTLQSFAADTPAVQAFDASGVALDRPHQWFESSAHLGGPGRWVRDFWFPQTRIVDVEEIRDTVYLPPAWTDTTWVSAFVDSVDVDGGMPRGEWHAGRAQWFGLPRKAPTRLGRVSVVHDGRTVFIGVAVQLPPNTRTSELVVRVGEPVLYSVFLHHFAPIGVGADVVRFSEALGRPVDAHLVNRGDGTVKEVLDVDAGGSDDLVGAVSRDGDWVLYEIARPVASQDPLDQALELGTPYAVEFEIQTTGPSGRTVTPFGPYVALELTSFHN